MAVSLLQTYNIMNIMCSIQSGFLDIQCICYFIIQKGKYFRIESLPQHAKILPVCRYLPLGVNERLLLLDVFSSWNTQWRGNEHPREVFIRWLSVRKHFAQGTAHFKGSIRGCCKNTSFDNVLHSTKIFMAEKPQGLFLLSAARLPSSCAYTDISLKKLF